MKFEIIVKRRIKLLLGIYSFCLFYKFNSLRKVLIKELMS